MPANETAQLNAAATRLLEVSRIDVVASARPLTLTDFVNDHVTSPVSNSTKDGKALASGVPQRRVIFLDETVQVHIILQSPLVAEPHFRHFLQRAEITLDTHAIGTPKPGTERAEDGQTAPVKDLIDTCIIEDVDPEIAIGQSSGGEIDTSEPFTYVVWKSSVHITRSRIRSYGPSVYFSAALRLRPNAASEAAASQEEYMLSGVPASLNLLDAFRSDPTFSSSSTKPPSLSLARLSKITPTSGIGAESHRPLRNPQRRLIRLVPALNTRIQLHRVGVSPTQAKILALLDVETSSFASGEMVLEDLVLSLSDGRAEPLSHPESMNLPLRCHPTDVLGYVFDLIPHNTYASTISRERAIHSISLRLISTLSYTDSMPPTSNQPPADPVRIPLKIQWRTPVDLSSLVTRQSFLPPLLSSASDYDGQYKGQDGAFNTHLITLTVSGPARVQVHDTLRWNLLVANRSARRTLRLALIPLTRAARNVVDARSEPRLGRALDTSSNSKSAERDRSSSRFRKGHRSRPTLDPSFFEAAVRPTSSGGSSDYNADASGDHQRLKKPVNSSSGGGSKSAAAGAAASEEGFGGIRDDEEDSGDPGLIPMTPDVRIGPLLPGSSAEASMSFAVLRKGVLRVEGIRVVDLDVEVANNKRRLEQGEREGAEAAEGEKGIDGEIEGEKSWIDVPARFLPDIIAVGGGE